MKPRPDSPPFQPRAIHRIQPRRAAIALTSLASALLLAGCSSSKVWSTWEQPTPDPRALSVQPEDRGLEPHVAWETQPLIYAENALEVSIEEAVFAALARNKDLRIQTFEPVIAGAFEQIERGAFLPELYGSLRAGEEEASETARATGEQFSVTGRDFGGDLGVRQTLPTGTSVDLGLAQSRSISSRTPEQQAARLGLSVTQSLLRGFGPSITLASVRQAEIGSLASAYELRGYAEAFVADVENAYWRYVLANEEITIFERSLELAEQELAEVEGRIEVGSMSPTDGAIFRSEVARRHSALINARANREERRLRLARLLNVRPDGDLDYAIATTSQPDGDPEPVRELESRIALALQSRPDLNEARLRLEQNRLQTLVTANGALPQLDLFLTLGKTGYSDTLLDSFKNIQDNSYDVTGGLRFSHYLGDSAAQARHLIARAEREQAAEAVLNHEQLVRLDVRLAFNELERTRQQIQASRLIRRHLEETVQGEVERFGVGATTALQVAQARRDLLEARIEEVETLINYRQALVDLYLSEGSLLERRGIRIP